MKIAKIKILKDIIAAWWEKSKVVNFSIFGSAQTYSFNRNPSIDTIYLSKADQIKFVETMINPPEPYSQTKTYSQMV